MRVMLDTNILISAFIFKSKKINELIYKLSKEHKIIRWLYYFTYSNNRKCRYFYNRR